jgi:hypothetical protein
MEMKTVKIKGQFKKKLFGKSIFGAPPGFKESDLRYMSPCGESDILDLLNDLVKWHNFENLEELTSGNVMIKVDKDTDCYTITQYRIEREWTANRKELVDLYKKITKTHK